MSRDASSAGGERLRRRGLPVIAAAAGGFGLAYAIVALFIFPATGTPSAIPVPNVVGLGYDSASARLQGDGFTAARGEQRYEDAIPLGTVLDQDPVPNTIAARGSRIVLDLSRGQRQVTVPPLVGLTQDQAQSALENAGLQLGAVHSVRNDAPSGQVLTSTPRPGASAPTRAAVSLTVSTGPSTVTVPDVTGQSYSAAQTLLTQLGLVVGPVTMDSASGIAANTVVAQSPGANSAVPAGAAITLTVAAPR